ncbi:WSC domain-containing protein 1-like [Mercenaria mercenaria]|uniref:WSC domain-containing protein 1-like n=1 Tax=Mercenaria mercenaria TaxID=6596 RepID=UPI00234E8688|nr:WSC domain-containing protein 1-like [Mercenaria mercenaria]
MLRKQSGALVLRVIAVGFIAVTVINIYLRSKSSFKGTTTEYNYKKNDKWMKFLTYSCIANWYPRMQNVIKESNLNECVPLIQQHLYENVTDKLLKNMITKCFHSSIMKNPVLFNISFIKEFVKNFSCPSPKYLNTPRPLVALASYPGSGNTWTRELIEAITGTFTGSIYTDWNFKGSKLCPARGNVYIVKTHIPSDKATSHVKCREIGVSTLNYTKAVFILRNPYQALLAEFNRQHSLKYSGNPGVGIASKSDFNTSRK